MRRRYLLDILKTGGLIPYSFSYLYHSLIPTSVNGRNVGNYLKITKVYGDSVVENQQCADNFTNASYWNKNRLTQTNSNNIGTFVVNSNAYNYAGFFRYASAGEFIKGHKYLICVKVKKTNGNANGFRLDWQTSSGSTTLATISDPTLNTWYFMCGIVEQTRENNQTTNAFDFSIRYASTSDIVVDTDSFEAKEPMFINLTQMFPFNTPTTTSDVRVQALLNRGYIAYNTGEIKSVDIGEFESEPYNLFDCDWERGNIPSATGVPDSTGNNIRTDDYIAINPNTNYTIEYDRTNCNTEVSGSCYLYAYQYDENKNYLGVETNISSSSLYNLTTLSNARYIQFKIYSSGNPAYSSLSKDIIKMCVHRVGTRTGYAPHINPDTLSFKAQLNGANTSKDTFEITSNGYVFTKNNAYVDLGTLTWTWQSANNRWYSSSLSSLSKAPTNNDNSAYILSNKYQVNSFTNAHANQTGIAISTSNTLFVYTTDGTNQPSGLLQYELATPQTITIPKKHLGIVDLGSLNWNYQDNWQTTKKRFYAYPSNIKQQQDSGIYCNLFMNASADDFYSQNVNMTIAKTTDYIEVRNDNYTDATTFKNAMNGVYLWYETESEVADIDTQIEIEAGGTLTSDSNVLPNVDVKFYPKGIVLVNNGLLTSDGLFLVDSSNDFITTTESI